MRRQYHIILTATWDSTTTNQSKHPPLGMLNSQQGILCCLRLTSSKILPHFILVSRGTVANKLYIASSMSCNNFVAVLNRFKTGAWFYSVQPHLPAAPAATKNATTQVHYICSFQTDRMFTDGAQGITRAT